MQFKDYLASFPEIAHLSVLNIKDQQGTIVHSIPAIEGKLGSLKLYNALAEKFNHQLNAQSAKQGIEWFAEYVEDAKANIGKHPNIDLLLKVVEENLSYRLEPTIK